MDGPTATPGQGRALACMPGDELPFIRERLAELLTLPLDERPLGEGEHPGSLRKSTGCCSETGG